MILQKLILKYITMFRKVSNHLALIIPDPDDPPEKRRVARETFATVYPDLNASNMKSYNILTYDTSLCGKWSALDQLYVSPDPAHVSEALD